MSTNSKIEWTDATWNPVRGCTKISPGCKNCYAEAFAERFRGVPGHPYEQGFDTRLVPGKLVDPVLWPKPKMIFVNSMSDLFEESVPDDYIETVCQVMKTADWHIYQVLTKRSERMRDLLNTRLRDVACQPHVWWGVSVEDKQYVLPRIQHLRAARAKMRFLSVEPPLEDLRQIDLSSIEWVIVGGESGPHAHPMEQSWVQSIREQCEASDFSFFFKQWGGFNKKKNGRAMNGRTYDEWPKYSPNPVPAKNTRQEIVRNLETLVSCWSPGK